MDTLTTRMEVWLVMLGVGGVIYGALYISFIRFKVKADKLGVRLNWGQLMGLKLRKTLTYKLIDAAGLAVKEGLAIDIRQLETHLMSGGDPYRVVKGIADNKRRGITITYQQAVVLDLVGREITQEEINRVYSGS